MRKVRLEEPKPMMASREDTPVFGALSRGTKPVRGGPTASGVFRIAIPAKTGADYTKLAGLIAAQPFAETVIEGRKPVDGS